MFRLGADDYEELRGFEWAWQSMDGSLVQAPARQSLCLAAEGLGRNPTDRGKSGTAGGGNASNRHVFKEALQAPANRLGIDIRVAHYPPYRSKHNPVEHRLFPHVTRACQGVVFHTAAIAKQFMKQAKTSTGLKVTVDILAGVHVTGKKCAADFLETMRIVFDNHLPRWNYRAMPLEK